MTVSVEVKRTLLEPEHPDLRIRRQCALLGLNRASYYYQAQPIDPLNLELLRQIDQHYMETPFYGAPRMMAALQAPWTADEVAGTLRQPQLRELILALAWELAAEDGHRDEDERAALADLARAFDVPEARLAEIRAAVTTP